MTGVGIAAEFNPFHKGHKYIVEKAHEHGAFVGAVMSGCFVQRGEPAVYDKFVRTRAALLNGADMVLELPVIYATGAADVFGFGCCDVLTKAGIFDKMMFGCEADGLEHIKAVGELLSEEPERLRELIKAYSDEGLSFPGARERAVRGLIDLPAGLMSEPNNILAVEYVKSLKKLCSPIEPIGIKRIGRGYNDVTGKGEFSSAAAVRKALLSGEYEAARSAVPENVWDMYLTEIHKGTVSLNDFAEELRYIILKLGKERLGDICDVTEGLENKIYKGCGFSDTYELIESLKSKRYTMAKIRRAILHILLDVNKNEAYPPRKVPYIRVLGVKSEKRRLLGELAEKASVPVITNVKKDMEGLSESGRSCLMKDVFAADLYMLKTRHIKGADFTEGLIII